MLPFIAAASQVAPLPCEVSQRHKRPKQPTQTRWLNFLSIKTSQTKQRIVADINHESHFAWQAQHFTVTLENESC